MLVFSTSLTASALNSGEYNPFGVRSIFILQTVNYTIRWTPLFPAYLNRLLKRIDAEVRGVSVLEIR